MLLKEDQNKVGEPEIPQCTTDRKKVNFSQLFVLLLLLILHSPLFSQYNKEKVKFSRIEVSKGLSSSNVTSIVQDSNNFLWVGTNDGLNKYDGYDFKVYKHNEKDTNSLITNIVDYIFEDSKKRLWVSTKGPLGGGLHYYDVKLDKFIRIPQLASESQFKMIKEDKYGNILLSGNIARKAFIGKMNPETKTIQYHFLFPTVEPIIDFIQESENEFWIGLTRSGFYKWNVQTKQTTSYSPEKGNSSSIIGKDITTLLKVDNIIWIGLAEGLSKFNTTTGKFENFTANPDDPNSMLVGNIRDIAKDRHNLWLATQNGGLSVLDTRSNKFKNYVYDKYDPFSLSDNSILTVYKDQQGRIWVGTSSKGLCVLDRLERKFAELDLPLENDVVNAIYADKKDRLWVGTEGGIAMVSGHNKKYYMHHSKKQGSLSANPILSIFEDSKNTLWFGTWEGGINRYIEDKDNFIHFKPKLNDPYSISNGNVYSIGEHLPTGDLLVSSYHGLNVMKNRDKGTFENYTDPKHEYNNYVRHIFVDSKNKVWIGTIAELNLYHPDCKELIPIGKINTEGFGKIYEGVNCIFEDKKGRIWVGSNNGLHLISNYMYVRSYNVKDGLPSNIIHGILEDKEGNLWLSTNNGLSRFHPDYKTVRNFDVGDGLLSNEFKPNACYKSKDGFFYFGGKGVIVFHPDSIQSNPHKPSVFITDFKLIDQSVEVGDKEGILTEQISETKEISLQSHNNFFTINYVAVNLSASDKNKYAYKLEGFNKDWVVAGKQRFATFTNLDAGTYRFRVKASNNDGVWNEEGTLLTIHILPPWWSTWWFRLTSLSLISGLIYVYYRHRVSRVEKQNKKLEEQVTERTKELQVANVEISNINKELFSRQEEINVQNDELCKTNDELIQTREEIEIQRDLLASQYQALLAAQKVIEEQNHEILLHNRSLDEEVKVRTKELIEYNQQLEQFAFIAAHNLRAPVARILGLGQILKFPEVNAAEEKAIIQKVIFTTEELDRVVKDISTILELRKNNSLIKSEVNLKNQLEIIKINLENEINNANAEIVEDISEADIIYTVKPYLDSILYNLLTNAIKYAHPDRKPVIKIKSCFIGDTICLQVSDNGLGIDLKANKKNIFSLYKRFHLHIEGKGMGLYLVKTQVAALGGTIEVESTVNKGTTFTIRLKKDLKEVELVTA